MGNKMQTQTEIITGSENGFPDAASHSLDAASSPKRMSAADIILPPFSAPVETAQPVVPDDTAEPEKEENGLGQAPAAPRFPVLPVSDGPDAANSASPAALPEDDEVFTAAPQSNPVIAALKSSGYYLRSGTDGQHFAICLWADEHGDNECGEAIYFEPTQQRPYGGFVCPCKHAEPLRFDRLLDRLGIEERAARCKPCIRNTPGEMVRTVDHAEKVLLSVGGFYQSGGAIVTVQWSSSGDAVAVPITEHALNRALALNCDFEKYDNTAKCWRRCDPPPQLVRQLLNAQTYEHLPILDHIARQPYFRESDDGFVADAGYDPVSRTYAAFGDRGFPNIASAPDAAREALDTLRALLTEFHFASPVDCSTALCAILTAAARSSLPLAPAFNVTASTPGSGKSYLGNLLAASAGPGEPLNLSYPTSSEEATKAMLAALIGKPAVISFDDMQTDWQPHGMINRMLTSATVADRLLGSNNTKQVSTKTFVMGTGNNVSPIRDMCRRVVTISLRPQTASPATLRYSFDPVRKVRTERERYVGLALTVIRAWREAGRPKSDVLDIGTFGAWSNLCRQPLIWLGENDPATSLIEQVQHDPDAELFGHMMIAWHGLFGSNPTMLRKVIDRAGQNAALHEAIMDLPVVDRGDINHRKFGWFLKKNANRIVNGMFVRKESCSERNAWSVQYSDPASAPPPEEMPDPAQAWKKDEEVNLPDGRVMINGEIF